MARLGKMKLLMLIALSIFLHSKNGALTEEISCNFSKKCEDKNLGTHHVDNPFNTSQYFRCIEDVHGNKRPSDAVFNKSKNYGWEYQMERTRASITYSTDMEGGKCIKECSGVCVHYLYGRIADMKNCSVFYTCLPGNQKVKSECPPEAPYFDGELCLADKTVCCSCCDQCTPYCYKKYTQVADPFDCKSFYFCFSKGFPEKKDLHKCPEDKYFDITKGYCKYEEKVSHCSPLCRNEILSD